MDWCAEIHNVMRERKLSQREFASQVKMSSTYIGDVLKGEAPSPKLKLRVLDMRGYDLASAAVLRLLLPKEVAEELLSLERDRSSDRAKRMAGDADSQDCGSKAAI